MLHLLFDSDISTPLLIILTCVLVLSDRAFPRKVRNAYYLALLGCLVLGLTCGGAFQLTDPAYYFFIGVFRPLTMLSLVFVVLETRMKDIYNKLFMIPFGVNLVACFWRLFARKGMEGTVFAYDFVDEYLRVSEIVFFLYFVAFLVILTLDARKEEIADKVLVGIVFILFEYAMISEYAFQNIYSIYETLSLITCILYFYRVNSIYKKDELTHLSNRHNLLYEMEDLEKKVYDVVLLDVDNFKMINDKYGHDRGDEALVTVVNTVKKNLGKYCRMYRYGGDEFVIISRKGSREELTECLDGINEQLSQEGYHISYGIVRHEKGEDYADCLISADVVMYQNKRQLKSENIWDDATGLFNYRGFLEELDVFRKEVQRREHTIFLISMDIEHLSNINRAYGYTEGNMIIATLGKILKGCIRDNDFVGHLGSDEFVVAMEVESEKDPWIDEFIEKVEGAVDIAYEFSEKDYTVDISYGKFWMDNESKASMEDCVNHVLYRKQADKDNRRKSEVIHGENDYNEQEERTILDVLDHNKFRYAFQPIVSAKNGNIVAYEALMRTTLETMISPLKILKYAHKNNRTYEIEKYTFGNVLDAISKENDILANRRVFINSIPGYLLTEVDYASMKEKFGDMYGKIVVEITEERELEEKDLQVLLSRRDNDGFALAIDDFGSGYSNTNSLLRYMPQIIKLDRLLIQDIDKNTKKQFFVNSIITFAKDNNMQVLAEGVETEDELRMVLHLGVDLIQGYYTAKPSFILLDEIDPAVRNMIASESMKVSDGNTRKVYVASENKEISLVHLALEDYTEMNITTSEVTVIGNVDYIADMCIKIKDDIDCTLVLRDVKVKSVDDLPCIQVGYGAKLTIRLEGQNILNGNGIFVPETSCLTMVGVGALKIVTQGSKIFGIGTGPEDSFGSLIFRNSGVIDIRLDGEECVGIGGGIYRYGTGVDIRSGEYQLEVMGVYAVGIGCVKGEAPITIKDCTVKALYRVQEGAVIASMEGVQYIKMRNFNLNIDGSGKRIAAIGTIRPSSGHIDMQYGNATIKVNGQICHLIGASEGSLDIKVKHVKLYLLGEGDEVSGIGTRDMESKLVLDETTADVIINSSSPLAYGAKEENVFIKGPEPTIKVNE